MADGEIPTETSAADFLEGGAELTLFNVTAKRNLSAISITPDRVRNFHSLLVGLEDASLGRRR